MSYWVLAIAGCMLVLQGCRLGPRGFRTNKGGMIVTSPDKLNQKTTSKPFEVRVESNTSDTPKALAKRVSVAAFQAGAVAVSKLQVWTATSAPDGSMSTCVVRVEPKSHVRIERDHVWVPGTTKTVYRTQYVSSTRPVQEQVCSYERRPYRRMKTSYSYSYDYRTGRSGSRPTTQYVTEYRSERVCRYVTRYKRQSSYESVPERVRVPGRLEQRERYRTDWSLNQSAPTCSVHHGVASSSAGVATHVSGVAHFQGHIGEIRLAPRSSSSAQAQQAGARCKSVAVTKTQTIRLEGGVGEVADVASIASRATGKTVSVTLSSGEQMVGTLKSVRGSVIGLVSPGATEPTHVDLYNATSVTLNVSRAGPLKCIKAASPVPADAAALESAAVEASPTVVASAECRPAETDTFELGGLNDVAEAVEALSDAVGAEVVAQSRSDDTSTTGKLVGTRGSELTIQTSDGRETVDLFEMRLLTVTTPADCRE